MEDYMEMLLHYVWQHRMFPLGCLYTTEGEEIEVIDPGLHNHDAGPDFFNAKIRIGGQLWIGNVEIHLRPSDWYRHHHETDPAYNNVILHVVSASATERREHDAPVLTQQQRRLPTIELPIPPMVEANYRELLAEEKYPPCYRVIPSLSRLVVHSWLSALTVERLEAKTERIDGWLQRTGNDWEHVFFITLARAYGFGKNSDAFERWAATILPRHISKHRDNLFQVQAFFLGQAGLIDDNDNDDDDDAAAPTMTKTKTKTKTSYDNPSLRDPQGKLSSGQAHTLRYDDRRLGKEYKFLQHKFGLTPLPRHTWKMGRMRPQNSPQVRLMQLAELYHSHRLDFSRIRAAKTLDEFRHLLQATDGRWSLSESSLDLLIINAVSPILFAYGRSHNDEALTERAFSLLEELRPENNAIIRSWAVAGITAQHAADSQALIQLHARYCERKDCLRCRFGTAYLKKSSEVPGNS